VGGKAPQATPIISIYFLGYRFDHVAALVIKVLRRYYDAATEEEIPTREEFIESLTHDSFVIQLGSERRTATERLLAIFDQHRKVESDGHVLDVEDEILAELEDMEHRMEKALAEKDQIIEEKDRALAERDRLIDELRGSR